MRQRRVAWSDDALDDLLDQIAYIAADNHASAEHVAKRLRDAGTQLGRAAIGRPGRVPGTKEKSVDGLPYVIAHAIDDIDEAVIVLRVIHSARDWPRGSWPR